jgi:DNA repair photolyase
MAGNIYEPRGKAREYCELALNLFRGCTHGCTYCYAPTMLHMTREDFHAKSEPRYKVLAALEKEARQFKGREVFLCFSCDPYPPDDPDQMARQAIKILHAAGVKVRILTKAGKTSERDFDLLAARPDLSFYGATLTIQNIEESENWEPRAAIPWHRIEALEHAHAMGIPTWLSLEPVLDTEETLNLIADTAHCVDMYKLGKWNHDKRANNIDWAAFVREAIRIFEIWERPYYIKKDLAVYL